ncbi:hypothetical protein ALQ03_102500 [Pseudomonas savastanoi pv. glycinea]|uniref:Uncharacterized protein n=1 Tax=Pseudomonas savastanoi pv. glycinea TaxID=318 RepID=A0A3M2V2D8_PSESG|nr:hypothetical protein ALQ97_102565 [Pseudomonas savastanoi pv. glycinea]RMM58792.1 hypothetical protein ALQ75_102964 [Pseudomonas savastanoi pv. glycinea]RMM89736.1 hypothetical protein ALQ70_102482 [Pseudomonas savastanoi pv. glycinea]RMN03982.1 hypothetical protein ALQ68_102985 [Pseudomonas savastanoi pv. glycinea]RMO35071.1 hypothetical protein ALQ42_102286 [Pseudomonas savastanoi pv. glycinea]
MDPRSVTAPYIVAELVNASSYMSLLAYQRLLRENSSRVRSDFIKSAVPLITQEVAMVLPAEDIIIERETRSSGPSITIHTSVGEVNEKRVMQLHGLSSEEAQAFFVRD